MLRKNLKKRALETEPDFRYRGVEPTRIEGFSDDVIAFCVTLLIVSLTIPENFSDLLKAFRGIFGFAISVLLLFGIWYEHYIFFLRYGLKDKTTIYLNGFLLFTVLIYIFPLKFLFSFFATFLGVMFGSGDTEKEFEYIFTHIITPDQMPILMAIYGAGAAAVFIIFTLMYVNAYKRREALELNSIEIHYTKWSIIKNACIALPPFLSTVAALLLMNVSSAVASVVCGPIYGLYGFMFLFGIFENRAKKKIEQNNL